MVLRRRIQPILREIEFLLGSQHNEKCKKRIMLFFNALQG